MFIKHTISEDEQTTGLKLSDLQTKVLQNRAIELAEELLAISPHSVDDYDRRFSYLQGQLHEINSMISISKSLNQGDSQSN